ncbi:MAG TPA: NAD(P)/FAD-dependent oxidoreductase [Alphaproteobacteria bacterium]|nr:NAD(P)/FAD-dependent oxidoreductase [Alphaproteobacteria bacterium]
MTRYDAVVVGAGFAGMYALHRLRDRGYRVRVFETGHDVGGTWYWNRYPGARCDVESLEYQYGFSDEIARGWTWTERYAGQPEIIRYADYVAKTLDLRRDIQFNTRVTSAIYDASGIWTVETDKGDRLETQFCVMATGCLSAARVPDIAGLESFKGRRYHTGGWPHEGVDFTGRRVAVIGTGSSGVQSIPMIAEQAAELFVFQRTPNFSLPALNGPLDPDHIREANERFAEDRKRAWASNSGSLMTANNESAQAVTDEERRRQFETRWGRGGFAFMNSYNDLFKSVESNTLAAEFVRDKIRQTVKDPKVADLLAPTNHPIGTKRLCLDTHYYETYNLPHVTLVDISKTPIEKITPHGLMLGNGDEYEVDDIVFATGFDAMTGALLRIDIRGRDGLTLKEKWAAGPRTYLGLGTVGFPNLFMITGPGSPSVLCNMFIAIEQHVDWVVACIDHMRAKDLRIIEAQPDAEDDWVAHVNEKADETLYPRANSWYVGANVPGKPRVFMPYVGGFAPYDRICRDVAESGYKGFTLT